MIEKTRNSLVDFSAVRVTESESAAGWLMYPYFDHGADALIAHHDCVIAIVIADCMKAAPSDPVSEAR
eukprot:3173961-Prymnesium_polylepis.1